MASGCKKFVEIGPPATQLVTGNVFSDGSTATSAQVAIYNEMANPNSESWNISQNFGILADELTSYSTTATQLQLYTNSLTPLTDNGRWTTGYNYIFQANAIIAGLQQYSETAHVPSTVIQQLTGESKFVRAFWNFYLTNMYGDIPLVTTTDYSVNDKISRTPQAEVYTQIIGDLDDALQLLNVNYVDGTDTVITTERVRPAKGAAEALLARVYLYLGKYDSAKIHATNVINNNLYTLCTNLNPKGRTGRDSVFLKNNKEAIWQLSSPSPIANNTADAAEFILNGAPGISYGQSTAISPQLLNSFEPGDFRFTNWVGVYKSGAISYYFPYKYQNTTTTSTEYVTVLRLAEQYLIRAESEVQIGDLSDGAADLNVIRNRAGLANISDSIATSQSGLLSAIIHERQIEFFVEWGHRWFDLGRTGNLNSVMGGASGVCHAKGGTWAQTDQLFPISQSEIMNDPNLSQNLGY